MVPINLRSKFHGTMLGLACGDALGYEVEFNTVEEMKRCFGPRGITELDETLSRRGEGATAYFSDDTQMSLAVARGLIASGKDATTKTSAPLVAQEFVEWSRNPPGGHRAPGGACMSGCHRLGSGAPWEKAGGLDAGGCGAVMRSAPYALRWWNDPEVAVEAAVRHGCMTHRHPLSLASCAAFVTAMHFALRDHPRPLGWDSAIRLAARYDDKTATMLTEDANLCREVRIRDDEQFRLESVKGVLERRRGWAGHEAICAALFCFGVSRSYQDAVVLAANSPGDSDSIACITGALAGAYYGFDGIPARWVEVIERRDELLATADKLLALSSDAQVLFQMEGSSGRTD